MIAEALLLVTRAVVGGMFVVAVVGKLRDLPAFRRALRGFRVVPRRLERPAVAAVLVAEVAVVLLVAVRAAAPVGLAVAALLLAAFAVAMARVLVRGDRVPCGCFGRSAAPVGPAHVARNVLLAAAAAVGTAAGATAPEQAIHGPPLLVLALFSAAVIAMLLLAEQLLIAPEAPPRPPPRRPEPSRHRPPVAIPSTGTTRKR